ncbi:type III polyketide synthase [Phenylobacterium sp.]|jgi:alkylresorcinol/alkylpyrone synthase|uniref:type III polyketide synthase n=1 Tax=Phenylobacterium sp. TaxID=1871053 RepID=UPI002F3F3247
MPLVHLLSLATATPPHNLYQDEVLEAANEVYGVLFPQFEHMVPVFKNAGVHARQVAKPAEWYTQTRTWAERSSVYDEVALDLFCQAAERSLAEAHLTGGEVDIIVTVSTTGISTPSLEARAMDRMGFRPNAARVPVFGIGCAGGATGMALAVRLAAAQPGCKVLLVCVELCSMAFRLEAVTKADIVSAAIFSDGAAACMLSTGSQGFAAVTGYAEHTWPNTLDIMGWRVETSGLGVVLAPALPPFIRKKIRPAMEEMLASQGLAIEEVDRFICHPGGMRVIEAIETAFGLGQGTLDYEREVLADHGNMSSPTVLFVLDRARRQGLPNRSVLTAMGPGFTASTVTLAAA